MHVTLNAEFKGWKDNNKPRKIIPRYYDGQIELKNTNIDKLDGDVLYHLALGSQSHDLEEMFGDIKFVCMGGTPNRMKEFAHFIKKEINYKLPSGVDLRDISEYSNRFCMFKIGPVLSVSHGMGIPSISIVLHEIIKLLYHAKCKAPIILRLGTCGGLGLEPGTVVVSDKVCDGLLQQHLELPVLGKLQKRPAVLDKDLVTELKSLHKDTDEYDLVAGQTMCTYDFYEGQGRTDGAFCEYTNEDKLSFLNEIHNKGVVNIEMESLGFASICHHAGIRAAVICVTLLDRLKGDQVDADPEDMHKWQKRPQEIAARLIKKHLLKD